MQDPKLSGACPTPAEQAVRTRSVLQGSSRTAGRLREATRTDNGYTPPQDAMHSGGGPYGAGAE